MALFPNLELLFGSAVVAASAILALMSVLPLLLLFERPLRRIFSRLGLPAHRPLSVNFVIGGTIITLIPSAWVLLIYAEVHAASRIDRALLRTDRSAKVLARDLSEVLTAHASALTTMADVIVAQPGREQALVEEFHRRHPEFVTMLIADGSGQVTGQSGMGVQGASEPPPLGRDISDRIYFVEAIKSRQPYVSNAFRGRGFGTDIIVALAAPIPHQAGIVQGSLLTSNTAARFDALELDPAFEIMTIDGSGKVVYASPEWATKPLTTMARLALLADVRFDAEAQFAPASGIPTHIVAAQSAAFGRKVLVRQPLTSIAASMWDDLQWLVYLMLAAILLGIAVGAVFARLVMRPLTRLADELAHHQLRRFGSLRLSPNAAEEIRQIYAGFRLMRWRVNSAVRDLDATISEREKVIDARTVELARRNEELDRMARTDSLTGVLNRRGFAERLDWHWPICQREGLDLALVTVDVDHFKAYNDRYGHPAGDEILQQIAAALARCAHRATDVVARVGGEEFALLLANTPQSGALTIAEAARTAIFELELVHQDSPFERVTVSLGLAVAKPQDESYSPESLVAASDQALYEAKKAGRNRSSVAYTYP